MRPFNLAEARILERNYCQEHVNRRLRIIGLTIVLTMVVAGGSFICRSMFAGQVQQTKSRLADAQGRYVRVKREMALINTKMSERKWQNQLSGGSNRWLGVMDSTMSAVPPDVWLDSIKSSDKDSTLEITGRALSFDALTAFIDSLRCRKAFGEVRLESAKMSGTNGATYVDFGLAVALKDGSGSETGSNSAGAPASSPSTTESPGASTSRVPEVQEST